jgi:AbrB family looped-hinge helix DNA binding protein
LFFAIKVSQVYHIGMNSTISAKGQITVPKAVRDKLGLRPGTTVEFELGPQGALLRKGHRGRRAVDKVLGILKRTTATDSLVDEMRGAAPRSWRGRH